jgi:hypothetical protein
MAFGYAATTDITSGYPLPPSQAYTFTYYTGAVYVVADQDGSYSVNFEEVGDGITS